jgi:hypothetical protein
MKKLFTKLMVAIPIFTVVTVNSQNSNGKQSVNFKENKGQVCDQNYNPRPDVLFSGNANGLNFHLTQSGISYQLSQVQSWKEFTDEKTKETGKAPDLISIYRVDINWINANKNAVVEKGESMRGYDNYYLQQCLNGALNVKSYKTITYSNLYSGIDLKWYEKNGQLEYDFIVRPFADYTKIQFEINGAKKLSINSLGELIIKTPFGEIIEKAPKTFQGNKLIESSWRLNNNILSFNINEYDHSLPLIIDPVIRNWGTYYGGSGIEYIYGSSTNSSGDVYVTGYSSSSNVLATVGAHQTNVVGGPTNAILTKFNSAGVRQWGTYYGAASGTEGRGCATFSTTDIFMVGYTSSTIGIATAGAHQVTIAGGEDAFIVKFNAAGVRQWATYYGGTGNDRGLGCATDLIGNIIMCGNTISSTGTSIATAGSHQQTIGGSFDAFVVKFNNAGTVRIWGTYYGGTGGSELAYSCATDNTHNIYVCGESNSSGTVIATGGSHQPNNSGGTDGFLVKFNLSGVRQWATFYGSVGYEAAHSCAVDAVNFHVYIAGVTSSPTSTLIASAGSHQTGFGGGSFDGFLARFTASGVRHWGTYYGGASDDRGYACVKDVNSDVYLVGNTNSSNGISTVGSYQAIQTGLSDELMAVKFNSSGIRQWGTYYGGAGSDYGYTACVNTNGLHFGGLTTTPTGTNIASVGSHQATYGGAPNDAFFAQLFECNAPASPLDVTPVNNLTVCASYGTTTLSVTGTGTISWYSSPTGGVSLSSGTSYLTPTLTAGVYTIYAESQTCAASVTRTPITLTVNALPIISIVSNSSLICIGQTTTLTANGANTYTWSTGPNSTSIAISPTATSTYTVIGLDVNGCQSAAIITQSVSACTGLINKEVINASDIFIYPNPTSDHIQVNIQNGATKLVITNILGQTIIQNELKEGENTIKMQGLSAGIYYFIINHTGNSKTFKVIKE